VIGHRWGAYSSCIVAEGCCALSPAQALLSDIALWKTQVIQALNLRGDRAPLARAKYDPNATLAPGLTRTANDMLSCMGQLDPLLTVRLR